MNPNTCPLHSDNNSKNMNWNNLKVNKCPHCNKNLFNAEVVGGMFHCSCGFKISEKRMREIVSNQIVKDVDRENHYRPDDENPE